MKKLILVVLALSITMKSFAGYYDTNPTSYEPPIPKFQTEYDYKKWNKARYTFLVTGAVCLAGAIVSHNKARSFRSRANGVAIVDNTRLVMHPVTRQYFHPAIPGSLDHKAKFERKSNCYNDIGNILAILGAAGLTVGFSLRF